MASRPVLALSLSQASGQISPASLIFPEAMRGVQDLVDAAVEQERVVVAARAVDDDVAPRRNGLGDRLGHEAAHLLVVEGDVEVHPGLPHQAVVAQHRDPFLPDLGDHRAQPLRVVGHDHQHVDAPAHELAHLLLLDGRILVRHIEEHLGAQILRRPGEDVDIPPPALDDQRVHGEADDGGLPGPHAVPPGPAARAEQGDGQRQDQPARESGCQVKPAITRSHRRPPGIRC